MIRSIGTLEKIGVSSGQKAELSKNEPNRAELSKKAELSRNELSG